LYNRSIGQLPVNKSLTNVRDWLTASGQQGDYVCGVVQVNDFINRKTNLYMNRILLIALPCVLMMCVAMTTATALFKWNQTGHDFGRIAQNKPVTARFEFINKGELPLLINQAKGSCGCTGVEYPKTAVLPGQSGVITATFNASSPGAFSKTVTVESNAENGTQLLSLKGEVIAGTASAN
jgi:hypothetical protein